MARVTAAEVLEIIEVDPTLTNLTPFITVANLLVDKLVVDTTITEAHKKEIERWLAAHFTAIRDIRPASETAGSVSESKQYKVGLNLQVTIYGQQACVLDTSGALLRQSQMGGTIAASLDVMEETPYDEAATEE